MGLRRMELTQEICNQSPKDGLKMKLVYFDAYKVGPYKSMIDDGIKLTKNQQIFLLFFYHLIYL